MKISSNIIQLGLHVSTSIKCSTKQSAKLQTWKEITLGKLIENTFKSNNKTKSCWDQVKPANLKFKQFGKFLIIEHVDINVVSKHDINYNNSKQIKFHLIKCYVIHQLFYSAKRFFKFLFYHAFSCAYAKVLR